MKLFVYGTLMAEAVMRSVCGQPFASTPATLHDFRRRRVSGEVYPAIIPCPGDRVEGALYSGLNATQLALLDVFEGTMYRRAIVDVMTGSGWRSAHTYIMSPAYRHALTDEPWSLDGFSSNGLRDFIGDYSGFAALGEEGDRYDDHR